jgi:hypothetical protein
VRRDLGGALRWLATPTIALGVVAGLAPGRFELALRIYALLLAAAVIVLALLALRRAFPAETALQLSESTQPPPLRPASLARTHNAVVLGLASSFDLHYRLVPRLRGTATGLLAARRGISLEASQDAARALLGEETWDLVRPDRPAPQDRLAPGIERERLARVVGAMEAI